MAALISGLIFVQWEEVETHPPSSYVGSPNQELMPSCCLCPREIQQTSFFSNPGCVTGEQVDVDGWAGNLHVGLHLVASHKFYSCTCRLLPINRTMCTSTVCMSVLENIKALKVKSSPTKENPVIIYSTYKFLSHQNISGASQGLLFIEKNP